jgi:5-methylcytosine-specific restriction protein A
VLIADHTRPLYEDCRIEDILFYTGMGTSGDQDISFMQNKTLYESDFNGIQIHLFEVEEPRIYQYMGRYKLCGDYFMYKQPDINGYLRKVIIFPLCEYMKTIKGNPKEIFYKHRQK